MYSSVTLVGIVGRDPEMKYLPNGQAVCDFSLATSRHWTDASGERASETTWWKITMWGKMAENVSQYLRKKSRVFVEGSIKPDSETGNPRTFTRNDGTTGASYEVTARVVRVLDPKDAAPALQGAADQEEIPF